MDFNQVFVEGRLEADATSSEAEEAVRFNIITNEDYKASGDWVRKSHLVPVVIFGRYGKSLMPDLKKSMKVIVAGKLESSYRTTLFIVAHKCRILEERRRSGEAQEGV